MKRRTFTAIPCLALGGLLFTGCNDGFMIAGQSDANPAQAGNSANTIGQNSDENELAVSAAVAGEPNEKKIYFKLISNQGQLTVMKMFYWDTKKNNWFVTPCIDIRNKVNVRIDAKFSLPKGMNLGYKVGYGSCGANDSYGEDIYLGYAPKSDAVDWTVSFVPSNIVNPLANSKEVWFKLTGNQGNYTVLKLFYWDKRKNNWFVTPCIDIRNKVNNNTNAKFSIPKGTEMGYKVGKGSCGANDSYGQDISLGSAPNNNDKIWLVTFGLSNNSQGVSQGETDVKQVYYSLISNGAKYTVMKLFYWDKRKNDWFVTPCINIHNKGNVRSKANFTIPNGMELGVKAGYGTCGVDDTYGQDISLGSAPKNNDLFWTVSIFLPNDPKKSNVSKRVYFNLFENVGGFGSIKFYYKDATNNAWKNSECFDISNKKGIGTDSKFTIPQGTPLSVAAWIGTTGCNDNKPNVAQYFSLGLPPNNDNNIWNIVLRLRAY